MFVLKVIEYFSSGFVLKVAGALTIFTYTGERESESENVGQHPCQDGNS